MISHNISGSLVSQVLDQDSGFKPGAVTGHKLRQRHSMTTVLISTPENGVCRINDLILHQLTSASTDQ